MRKRWHRKIEKMLEFNKKRSNHYKNAEPQNLEILTNGSPVEYYKDFDFIKLDEIRDKYKINGYLVYNFKESVNNAMEDYINAVERYNEYAKKKKERDSIENYKAAILELQKGGKLQKDS